MKPKIIAFTPGEPAGIGPDLASIIAQQSFGYCIVAISDSNVIQQRARQLGFHLTVKDFDGSPSKPGELQCLHIPCPNPVVAGKLNKANAAYVLETIGVAARGCMDKKFDAMVTAPIQKSIINDAGIVFSGHTEFLAELCHGAHPVMMLANRKLKVALVTTHMPLSQVSASVTDDTVRLAIEITHNDLQYKFGIANPKIAICGLNPHAGENGHLGREEIEIISPAIEQLKTRGLDLMGPLPADTAFTTQIINEVDAFIAMYHDQGLPVVKALGFGETVNITLGLPIIRTSVDHGTALSLAGTGKIESGSLIAAFEMAHSMVNHRPRQ